MSDELSIVSTVASIVFLIGFTVGWLVGLPSYEERAMCKQSFEVVIGKGKE